MAPISVKKRHTIRKSQATELFKKLKDQIGAGAALYSARQVEKIETDSDFTIYLIDRKPLIMEYEGQVFPTLRGAIERQFTERTLVVDSGAVAFMVKGADIMRPGIVSVTDDVKEGRAVLIVEERHNKPLAVGIALLDAAGIRDQVKGKSARNIHYVGDALWNLEI